MSRHRIILLILAAAVIAIALLTMSTSRVDPERPVAQLAAPSPASGFDVTEIEIDDLKSVFATVRSRDQVEARVRIAGTITELRTDEGRQVKAGEVLALVADQKIALRMGALDAQISGARSRMEAAKIELERATELVQRRVAPQSRLDQAKAAYDTAATQLQSAEAERQVVVRQIAEGEVLAPAEGRVLRVPVTVGSVVMAGESVATIAANAFLLRLEVPERHARYLRSGDLIRIGPRGMSPDQQAHGTGRIVQVYPELRGGRVVADAEADALGTFFVGERVRVWIAAGKRRAIIIPAQMTFIRFGLNYVRLATSNAAPVEVVIQIGRQVAMPDGAAGIEVLAGLRAGDTVVAP